MRISDWSSDVGSSDLSDGLATLGGRHQHLHRTHLINHVDGLVGQLAIIDVARGKLHGRLDRVGRVFDFVVIFEGAAEPSKDLDRILDGRLVHVDLLEPAQQGTVLFEMVAEFLVRRRTNRSEEHTSELQSLMRISYAVFCLKKKKIKNQRQAIHIQEEI